MTKIAPLSAADRLMKASKNSNFNIRKYANARHYIIASTRLEGTTLGEKNASLKILIGELWDKTIFAIMKSGKVLGAKSVNADSEIIIPSIIDKLYKKGRITKEEYQIVKSQLPFQS